MNLATSLLRFVMLALLLATLAARPAAAEEIGAAVARLAAASYADKLAAVEAIAASGDARAAPVLEALLAGRLFVRRADGAIVLAEGRGQVMLLSAPLSGEALGESGRDALDEITLNNRLRGALRGALGALSLLGADADHRAEAADAVFKSRDRQVLPLLDKALVRETAPAVRLRLERARAGVVIADPSAGPDQRIAAAAVLARFGDPEVRSLLAGITASGQSTGHTPDQAEITAAAAAALAKVEARLAIWSAVGGLFQGISLGSVLVLAAVGLAITFGVMGVINMAHGELVMIGAYTTFVVQDWLRAHAPEAFDYSLAIAVPAAFVITALVGIAIERGIIRFLYGRPLETLLATWGVSLILQQAVRSVFGPTNREVGNPSWMSGSLDLVGGLTLTYNRIWIIVFSLAVFALLLALIRATAFGLRMRAVTQNRRMAAAMGIRTGRIDALTFGLGAGIAGIAGVALSQIDNVGPNLGQGYIIDSFMVVVFGGVGNLWGTLVGGFTLGLVNKLLEPYAGAVLGKILVLVAIILFIQKRPRGLFALKGRAVEA